MHRRRDWIELGTAIAGAIAWGLANGLDVYTLFAVLQQGAQLVVGRHHPAEYLIIYAGLRLLGALAVYLAVLLANRLWPANSRAAWGALTGCTTITTALALWRLYR